jgi:O-antigen/teichoic acid export membrane protein
MSPTTELRSAEGADERAQGETSKHLRGSSMLLVGRLSSIVINLGVQALVVRALSKTEYGAFAYALSLTQSIAVFLTLGIDRALPRFVALYDERKEYGHLVGTLVIQLTTILGLGSFFVVGVIGLQGYLSHSVIGDGQVVGVLVVHAVLVPIQALDDLAVSLFAVYARPRSIFFRRYVLEPFSRVAVITILMLIGAGPRFLALGYVVTGVFGVALYTAMLLPLLRKRRVIPLPAGMRMQLPWKAVLAFSLPLMSSDLLYSVLNTTDVVLIRQHAGAAAVGAYRAIQPFAKMNQFVFTSFALLYTPMVSRLLERADRQGIADLYWKTAAWIAVLSFPLFAVTFSLAKPIATTVLGARYADSGIYLSLLSAGYYFNAALGFNGLTVKTAGRVRYTVVISFIALGVNLALNFVLIPRFDALGAAVANLTTLVVHNLLKQAGLRLSGGIELYRRELTPIYVAIVATAGLLFALQQVVAPPLVVGLVLAGVASLIVLMVARPRLDIMDTFPELGRMPYLGRLLGAGA